MERRPLFMDPPVTPPGQPMPFAAPGSGLAAALMRTQAPQAVQSPIPAIPLGSMAAMMKTEQDKPSPYASMTPEQMAQQTSSNMPLGAAGSPSAGFAPKPDWMDQVRSWLSSQPNSGMTGALGQLFGRSPS